MDKNIKQFKKSVNEAIEFFGLYSYNKYKFLQSLGKDIIGETYKEIGFSIKSIDK